MATAIWLPAATRMLQSRAGHGSFTKRYRPLRASFAVLRRNWRRPLKVMVLVKATADSEAGILPSARLLEAMGAFNQQLAEAGVLLAGEGLKPSAQGVRIAFDGERREVIHGPFAATPELVAGFWIWQVDSLEDAIAWAKRCPNPMPGPSELELRPLYGPEDFGEAFSDALREQEDRLRCQLQG